MESAANIGRETLPRLALFLERYIRRIARDTVLNGGVAFDLTSYAFLPPEDRWDFPKYPSKTLILPPETDLAAALSDFIRTNEPFLREPDRWLGTWIHPQTHEFYLDIATGCQDVEEAKKIAMQVSQRDGRQVVAIHNSKRKETIYL